MQSLNLKKLIRYTEEQRSKVFKLLDGYSYKDKDHPIFNFIFQYFHFKESILFQYSPGLNAQIEKEVLLHANIFKNCKTEVDLSNTLGNTTRRHELILLQPGANFFNTQQLNALCNTLQLLQNSQKKAPSFHCFGLHEWAMLYYPNIQSSDRIVTHQNLKLRLNFDEIAKIINQSTLRCTHIDAFRFFTDEAKPLNLTSEPLVRSRQAYLDNPGCLHVHMDLFKWAIKIFPFVSSELLLRTLEIAIDAREIDMRASPYDLLEFCSKVSYPTRFNYHPIKIETKDGKKEYQKFQLDLYYKSQPIRSELISVYEALIQLCYTNKHDSKYQKI